MSRRATVRRVAWVSLLSLASLIAASALSLAVGVEHVDLSRALAEPGSVDALILGTRASRLALGILVGAALAPAGVAFQALLRNPLADPYVLGIAGGASVAGTGAIVLGAGAGASLLGRFALPAWAFVGAATAVALVFTFGRVRGRLVPNMTLLAGVVLNSLCSAIIVAIRVFASPTQMHQALYWLTGTLAAPPERGQLLALSTYTALGLVLLMARAVPMNAFALGDEAAHTVGIDTERARRTIFLAASLLTGAAVAVAGPIGFVGIVVPHVMRGLLGPDHRTLLPASALMGATFLVITDTLARLAFLVAGTEPPGGVLTALVGAPFFLVVLRRRGATRMF